MLLPRWSGSCGSWSSLGNLHHGTWAALTAWTWPLGNLSWRSWCIFETAPSEWSETDSARRSGMFCGVRMRHFTLPGANGTYVNVLSSTSSAPVSGLRLLSAASKMTSTPGSLLLCVHSFPAYSARSALWCSDLVCLTVTACALWCSSHGMRRVPRCHVHA